MNRAILSLTKKDSNRKPVGPLVIDMQFVSRITDAYSLYSFSFDPQGGTKLEFMLAGDACTTFFSLLDDILTPNTTIPDPPMAILPTADPSGAPKGELKVTVSKVKTFIDKISLFRYSFVLDGGSLFEFMLTSTDAGAFFSGFDNILWSNPPNPPHDLPPENSTS